MSAMLAPDKILKDLSKLWVTQGKESREEGGVLRACTMTLVVLSEESDDPADVGETIAALMPEHPARAIVVRLSGSGGGLSQRVYAQCWKPFGQRRQICCEQVELMAPDAALAELPPVVLPLTVADLPVIVWCRSGRIFDREEFLPMAAMGRKLVLDTRAVGRRAVRKIATLMESGLLVGDLAWTRLTRWRQMLAQVFENRGNLAKLPRIGHVSVTVANDTAVSGMYLGAWVSNALSDAGVRAALSVDRAERGVRLVLEGDAFRIEIDQEDGRMVTTVDGMSHCTNLPVATEYLLLREELGIVRPDPVFARTLASAARLAYPNE
jgi:glucose-6-phosphate dehydrogenase assembly protein OpcA